MFNPFKFIKKNEIKKKQVIPSFKIEIAAYVLAYEVARSDGTISNSELEVLLNELKKITSKAGKSANTILKTVEEHSKNSISFYKFIESINNDYSKDEKISLIRLLWDVAYADNILEVNEERLVRRVADLINIKDIDVLKLKDSSKNKKN